MTIHVSLSRTVKTSLAAAAIGFATVAAACTQAPQTHGQLPFPETVEEIEPGRHTEEDIVEKLGSPSIRASFTSEPTWYYIGKRVEQRAFLDPRILEHKVLEVRFDDQGSVARVGWIDAGKLPKTALVKRETETKGSEMTLLRQLVGNIGRVRPQGAVDSTGP